MCPICKSDSKYSLTTAKHGYEIFSCINKKCNHYYFKDFHPGQGVDEREENNLKESDDNLKKFGDRNKKLLNYFIKNIGNKERYTFMDFGSGVAHISRTFKNTLGERVKILCFEPNKNLKGLYDQFYLKQISDINEANEKYDLIYLIEVIEHLDNPLETLLQISKIMDNDTKLFITTPKAVNNINGDCYDNPAHIHFFTINSLNYLLELNGFKKIKLKYIPEMYVFDSVKYKKEKLKAIIINFLQILGYRPKFKFENHLTGFTQLK